MLHKQPYLGINMWLGYSSLIDYVLLDCNYVGRYPLSVKDI